VNDLPLLVALPIAGAVVALALGPRRRLAGAVVTATLVAQVALAVWLSVHAVAATGGRVSHVVGGFVAPYGIELALDGVSALVVVLVPSVVLLVRTATRVRKTAAFGALALLLVGGLSGVAVAADVFTLYVFLEITGIAAYALVAAGGGGRAAVAAFRYLIVGTVGATLYLLGVGYLYVATGTLNVADLAARLPPLYDSPLVLAAFALVAVGLGVKVALFPLHAWQPDAYEAAPDDVSAMLAALVSTVAAYALFRVVADVFTPAFLLENETVRTLALAGALASVVAGSVLAVRQAYVKRMLAYSSVAQFGLVVAAFLLATETAAFGGVVHLVGHAVVKVGLFVAVGAIAAQTGARTVEEYAGLAARAPVHAALFGVLALTLVGVPPTVGFAGKWFIALGAVEAGAWGVVAVILGSTLLTLAYVVRLLERMYGPALAPARTSGSAAPTADSVAVTDGGAGTRAASGPAHEGPETETETLGDARLAVALAALAAVGLGLAVGSVEVVVTPALEAFTAAGVGP
jgi:multicomponent Na+:H+ antiporter subunit D